MLSIQRSQSYCFCAKACCYCSLVFRGLFKKLRSGTILFISKDISLKFYDVVSVLLEPYLYRNLILIFYFYLFGLVIKFQGLSGLEVWSTVTNNKIVQTLEHETRCFRYFTVTVSEKKNPTILVQSKIIKHFRFYRKPTFIWIEN